MRKQFGLIERTFGALEPLFGILVARLHGSDLTHNGIAHQSRRARPLRICVDDNLAKPHPWSERHRERDAGAARRRARVVTDKHFSIRITAIVQSLRQRIARRLVRILVEVAAQRRRHTMQQ